MRIATSLIPFVLSALVHAVQLGTIITTVTSASRTTPLSSTASAFPTQRTGGNTLANLQTYLASFNVSFQNNAELQTAKQRLLPVVSVGVSGRRVGFDVHGCSQDAIVGPTSADRDDLGIALRTTSLGRCGNQHQFQLGHVDLSRNDNRKITTTIFSSPDSGFGVISDIDDTVKESHVLETLAFLKSTLVDEPTPVAEMPELYASLANAPDDPQFVYISGSPSPLYYFLRGFISTRFSQSRGPILLRNFTFHDISDLTAILSDDGIEQYKGTMIDRVKAMYPNKRFLTIGDSTQRDPETYGDADAIACIWIRQVSGANNTLERFDAAFQGVPANRTRVLTDDEIPSMQSIDVAGGQC